MIILIMYYHLLLLLILHNNKMTTNYLLRKSRSIMMEISLLVSDSIIPSKIVLHLLKLMYMEGKNTHFLIIIRSL